MLIQPFFRFSQRALSSDFPSHLQNLLDYVVQRVLESALESTSLWEFPGGPVVRTQCFYYWIQPLSGELGSCKP